MTEYKQLSLRQAAKFDRENGLAGRLTGWGRISKERREKGISRKARRKGSK